MCYLSLLMLFHKEHFAHTKYKESNFRCIFTRTLSFSKIGNLLMQVTTNCSIPRAGNISLYFCGSWNNVQNFYWTKCSVSLNRLCFQFFSLAVHSFPSCLTRHCFLYNIYSLIPFICPYVRIHPRRLLFSLTEYYTAEWEICSLFVWAVLAVSAKSTMASSCL